MTGVTFGSTDSDSFTYDSNTGRMATYTFAVNSHNDKGTLTWNTNGTLNKFVIADSISGTSDSQTCNYLYDDLGRIGGQDANGYSVDCGTKWQQLFAYDSFGNLSKTGNSSFTPMYSATQNQFTSIPGVTVHYDANGNLLTDNLNTYTWDANWVNPASVNSSNLIYDGLGRMVEQQNGSSYSQILYSPAGKTALMNGSTLSKAFIYLPGGATAIYNSTGLAYYRHSDWIGSSRLTSTASRGLYSSSSYAPFGEQYAVAGTTDPSFTGQNADTSSTLYDFTFREYSPSQGRWISPDPAGMAAVDPANPQTWNRYAYVLNNPLSLVDTMGLYCVWDDGSHDSPEDPETGTASGCGAAGGTWYEGSPADDGLDDWSAQANADLAGQIAQMLDGVPNGATFYAQGISFADFSTGDSSGISWAWTFTRSFLTFDCGPGNKPTCAANNGTPQSPQQPKPQQPQQPQQQPWNKEKFCANWNAANYFAGAWALGFAFSGVGTVPGLIVGGVTGVSAVSQGIYCGL